MDRRGYPTCQQWWSDGSNGLRARLLAQVDPDLLTRIGHWAGFLSQNEVNDSVIRAVVSPQQQKMNQGSSIPTTAVRSKDTAQRRDAQTPATSG